MVWALPATMLRPYKQFEDHLNTICIPCVLETPKTICIPFGVSRPCKGHAHRNASLNQNIHNIHVICLRCQCERAVAIGVFYLRRSPSGEFK